MKARLQPIYFANGKTPEFENQLDTLKELLMEEAVFLDPLELGTELPSSDAVVFPVLIGAAYQQVAAVKAIKEPLIVLTSEFGTVAMWDWEIVTFLKAEGMKIFAPYDLSLTKVICRALATKQELKGTKFLVFQDNPGVGGMQPEIFKRFYWWEDSCTALMQEKFGILIVRKSFEVLGAHAKTLSDEAADAVLSKWEMNQEGMTTRALRSAAKMYLAIKEAIAAEGNVGGVGINCLNESSFSDTTPCLARNAVASSTVTSSVSVSTLPSAVSMVLSVSPAAAFGRRLMKVSSVPTTRSISPTRYRDMSTRWEFKSACAPNPAIFLFNCQVTG